MYEPFVKGGVVVAQLGDLMETMIRSMVRYRARIPRELVLLSKQMLYLEGAAHALAPDMDLLQEQNLIYLALMPKYPELAVQIVDAIEQGRQRWTRPLSTRPGADGVRPLSPRRRRSRLYCAPRST